MPDSEADPPPATALGSTAPEDAAATEAGALQSDSVWTSWPVRVAMIVAVVGISVGIYLVRDQFTYLAAFGYPGIFLVSLLGNATIVLPAPYLVLVFTLGKVLPPVLVGLAAGAGSALGEVVGFAAGMGGRRVIERRRTYERLTVWMKRHGDLTLFLLALIPNPIADIAGIIAGSLRYPLWRFLAICWLGKTLKLIAVAYAGALSITLVEQWLQ